MWTPWRRQRPTSIPAVVSWPTYDMTRLDPEAGVDYCGSTAERLERVRRAEIARHQAAADTARLGEAARMDAAEQDRRLRQVRNLADLERQHDVAAEDRRGRRHEHTLADLDRLRERAERLREMAPAEPVREGAAGAESVPRGLSVTEELRGLNRDELRAKAAQAGLSQRGSPADLRARLLEHAARQLRAVGE